MEINNLDNTTRNSIHGNQQRYSRRTYTALSPNASVGPIAIGSWY
jgi:hypothetical protein